jgi:protein-L-isoaspartate(D-aspartate) O-methyltransferase
MDFERARFNMIEQQIRPWDVLDPLVLETLTEIRREAFVPPALRNLAFADMEIPLDIGGRHTGEVMLAPKVEARLLQAAAVDRSDKVLEIGTGSGFMAALLARLADHVVSYEILPELAAFGRANLARAGLSGLDVREGNGLSACGQGEVYDLIVLSGSVQSLPQDLLDLLAAGGRLVAIVGELPVMNAQLITRMASGEFSTEVLFDTVAAPLKGFPTPQRFVF